MQVKKRNKDRLLESSLLNEHWKRKQRLKSHQGVAGWIETRCQVFKSLPSEQRREKENQMAGEKVQLARLPAAPAMVLLLLLASSLGAASVGLQSDPRPTIYSGQISFALLLSAHSSSGSELSSSASHQVRTILAAESVSVPTSTSWPNVSAGGGQLASIGAPEESGALGMESRRHRLQARQIFGHSRRHQAARADSADQTSTGGGGPATPPSCNQINPNALFAGMGAIWASHQANLVGDSQLAIGTYVYDSCNDLDVGQRQSVRIVSNLNAFQQTTCESPRGSPISLTIAHGDHQLRAIQLLTSFKVPVIATKENFAMEDYNQLTRDQRRFLFATAPSSRHLAVGALRFSKRIVSRSTASPKLPNQFYKMSSKNGLIVISRNLPARFISYLAEMIPNHVNYEMLQSSQPIDQISSVATLESILTRAGSSSSGASESSLSESRAELEESESGESASFSQPGEPDEIPAPSLSDKERDTKQRRRRRQSDDSDTADLDGSKMLSPTILMFITPAEAIDLITRLRNDLAEVSKYFSLIVATREDISPALKTIFHRGGSRLCSGKAFYTISPRPDEISEFTRYFRDTVQMEGESSDHPLVCEFAKFQSTSKMSADLDDLSAEPVIKAVWAASAAFKNVHKRECGPSMVPTNQMGAGNAYRSGGSTSSPLASGAQVDQSGSASVKSQRQTSASGAGGLGGGQSKSAHSECLVRMNKNLSSLVQRALKRLDVAVNSTGLQALDGFRLRFDDMNELMTNKFSIKYINKECEMVEIGQFSGFKDSSLRLDEELLVKSLESTLPDAWPPPPIPQPPPASSTSGASTKASTLATSETTPGDPSPTATGKDGSTSTDSSGSGSGGTSAADGSLPDESSKADEEEPGESSGEKAPASRGTAASNEAPYRASRRGSRTSHSKRDWHDHQQSQKPRAKRPHLVPLTALNGRDILPGLTDGSAETSAAPSGRQHSKPMRQLKPFPSATTSLSEWQLAKAADQLPTTTTTTSRPIANQDEETTVASQTAADLSAKATTRPPATYTTLPESGGNADLELPPSRVPAASRVTKSTDKLHSHSMEPTLAATESSLEYATLPSFDRHQAIRLLSMQPVDLRSRSIGNTDNLTTTPRIVHQVETARLNYLRDLDSTPIPLTANPGGLSMADAKVSRLKLRSHIRWIYSSWFALSILTLNICGALITLYVLTFLLMKNCDGSLERENQGLRSMHLLAIVVVFFGSTLFIVYPTPGLCLLRASWHNFALVFLFGSLLVYSMQARSLSTLGLGGRPNRLNQFLTLMFMVGVQVSFELQRWKYESANYLHFVNQYFKSDDEFKKLNLLNNVISGSQFSVLNSLSDQVTPVSIQMSEQYEGLLQDYCLQRDDEFLQGQIYLCLLVIMLVVLSLTTRAQHRRLRTKAMAGSHSASTTSGKLVASQHEANLAISSSQDPFHFGGASLPSAVARDSSSKSVFLVTMICVPIYLGSLLLHLYGSSIGGQLMSESVNRDLIFSLTLVSIAFVALAGIFLPILLRIHRCGQDRRCTVRSSGAPIIATRTSKQHHLSKAASSTAVHTESSAFAMFPEFSPTGLRRPASVSGDSSSGAGSRRPFARTKESRRNMSAALANLDPTTDSLRNLGLYGHSDSKGDMLIDGNLDLGSGPLDVAALNLKLNLSANDQPSPRSASEYQAAQSDHHHAHHQQNRQQQPQQAILAKRLAKAEKRLIMLDVDPCCPRHGIGAAATSSSSISHKPG